MRLKSLQTMSKFDLDVANFAESLITEDVKPENRKETLLRAENPYINASHWDDGMKGVSVTDDIATQFMGLSESKKPRLSLVVEKKRDLNELIAEFKTLVTKAKEVLAEITSVGGIGVNTAGPSLKKKKKKKYGSAATY